MSFESVPHNILSLLLQKIWQACRIAGAAIGVRAHEQDILNLGGTLASQKRALQTKLS